MIYYSDKYLAFLRKECFDLVAVNFLELDESLQEPYVKQAVRELSENQGIVPHDKEAEQAQQQATTVAKKLILPNSGRIDEESVSSDRNLVFALTLAANTPGKHTVALSWTASTTSGATYNIYRGTAAGVCTGTPTPYATGITTKATPT